MDLLGYEGDAPDLNSLDSFGTIDSIYSDPATINPGFAPAINPVPVDTINEAISAPITFDQTTVDTGQILQPKILVSDSPSAVAQPATAGVTGTSFFSGFTKSLASLFGAQPPASASSTLKLAMPTNAQQAAVKTTQSSLSAMSVGGNLGLVLLGVGALVLILAFARPKT